MTTPARLNSSLAVAAAVLALAAGLAHGGGAFVINGNGDPVLWDTSQPIVFNIDQGPLGQLTPAEAQALAEEAFAVWGQFPTASSVSFQRGALLQPAAHRSILGRYSSDAQRDAPKLVRVAEIAPHESIL